MVWLGSEALCEQSLSFLWRKIAFCTTVPTMCPGQRLWNMEYLHTTRAAVDNWGVTVEVLAKADAERHINGLGSALRHRD